VTDEELAQVKILVSLIGLAFEVYLLWIILPPSVKLPIQLAARREWEKLRALRERRLVRKELDFETFLVASYLTDYNRHRDPARLEADLAS